MTPVGGAALGAAPDRGPSGQRRGRLAIIGLDGGTFRVLEPVFAAGAMPVLERIRRSGISAILRSTVPPYTPPGWASMSTGVNPAKHNTFGFLATTPQEPPRLAHSGHVAAPALWDHLNSAGLRVGVFNVPMSYPPVAVDGFMVSGGIAAGWQDPEMPNYASDPKVGALVNEVSGGHYPLDTEVSYELDWRSLRVAERIEAVQRLRRRALGAVLEAVEVDVLYAVFEGVDRLQHLHYQYLAEWSEWYQRPSATEARDRAFGYFRELDRAIEDILDWAGDDGHVLLVSDHGGGPWEKTVNVNLLLEEWGYLRTPPLARTARLRAVAGPGQRLARRLLPRKLLNVAKAKLGERLVWADTTAFASHVAEQGIHINERGGLPRGTLDGQQAARVEAELVDRLATLSDPQDGKPVVDRVVRRAEALAGPFLSRAPHLFPLCRDLRYELSDTLAAASTITDHRDRPWGCHHSDGIFMGVGPGLAPGSFHAGLDIVDVLPLTLHLLGLPVPKGMDGRVPSSALRGEPAARPVTVGTGPAQPGEESDYPFSPEEERSIEESLRALGYVE